MERVPKEKVPAPVEERDRAAAARPREAVKGQERAAGKDKGKAKDKDKGKDAGKGKDADKADGGGGGGNVKSEATSGKAVTSHRTPREIGRCLPAIPTPKNTQA